MDQILMRILATDFLSFAIKFFQVLNPGIKFEDNWHLDAMAAQVDKLMSGATQNLLITMPPRGSVRPTRRPLPSVNEPQI